MKIAVVILNWNGVLLLEQFLPSVVKNSSDAVIYVADNASTDTSLLMLKHISISVRIVKTKAIWALHGYNEALKQVDAELYALVNSDIEVTENWLQPILTTFKRTQYGYNSA
jgi:GT2 family glycosyltransferase